LEAWSPEEERDFAKGRSRVYRLLALVFAEEPKAATLQEILTGEAHEPLAAVGAELGENIRNSPELAEALAVEYARLFLDPVTHLVPNESVQRGEGRYWGDHTVRVADFYARFGYQVAEGEEIIPDHLASELEFMGHLAAEEAGRWAAGNSSGALARRAAAAEFLEAHLLAWAPGFCARVARRTEEAYFARFAELTRMVLLSDASHLGLQAAESPLKEHA